MLLSSCVQLSHFKIRALLILYICQPVHNLYFLDKYVGTNVRVHQNPKPATGGVGGVDCDLWGTGGNGRCEACSRGDGGRAARVPGRNWLMKSRSERQRHTPTQ